MPSRRRVALGISLGFAIGFIWSSRFRIGHPREWKTFSKTHAAFLKALPKLESTVVSILRLARPGNSSADRVVFLMGCLCWEDFKEVLVLCGNGYGIGASKVLRSLYEHAVTAQYIAKHPEVADRFEEFARFQRQKAVRVEENIYGIGKLFSAEIRQGIISDYESLGFKYTGWRWSEKTVEQIVLEDGDGLEKFYMQCYFDPSIHLHATPLAIASRLRLEHGRNMFVTEPQRDQASSSLCSAHAIILLALRTQIEYFKIQNQEEVKQRVQEYPLIWLNREPSSSPPPPASQPS